MDNYDAVDWLCTVWGAVGQKQKIAGSRESVSDWERLIDILGYTEYCVSNAGDFANMEDIYPSFQRDALLISKQIGLLHTAVMFEQSEQDIIEKFDEVFVPACIEIKEYVEALPNSGSVGQASLEWKPD
jgi:hypothetical protein